MNKFFRKINELLNKNQKLQLVTLSFFLLIGMIFEFLSIGILIPVINVVIKGESTTFNIFLSQMNMENLNQNDITLILLSLIIAIYTIKIGFLYLLNYKNYTFLNYLSANLSLHLYKKYINYSYDFHIKNNSAFLIKNINQEVSSLRGLLEALISIIIEGLMLVSILILLIYLEPLGAIIITSFLFIFSTLFYLFYKSKINFWGELRQKLDNKIVRSVIETFNGIQEIKIYNKNELFFNNYLAVNKNRAKIMAKNDIVGQLPKLYLEYITIISLLAFVFFMVLNGIQKDKIILTLGIYAAASIKLIPSINKIIYSIQRIKFNMPALDIIHNQIIGIESNSIGTMHTLKKIIFKNVTFKKISFQYNDEKIILEDLDFKIESGKIIGIVGKSGVGKTTLVNILSGLLKPSKGQILINDILQNGETSYSNLIGYVPQTTFLMDTSIKKNICFGNEVDETKYRLAIKQSQLEDFINNLKAGDSTLVGEKGIMISGGQRQRISIARALYNDSQIIIFDEPTSALDSKTQEELINSLITLKGQKTIILISHVKSVMKNCDEIYEISNKKINRINEQEQIFNK